MADPNSIAVVIPCFRVKDKIGSVIKGIGPIVKHIICIDDACPDMTGQYILDSVSDSRVLVLFNDINIGVGGSVIKGYEHAIHLGADIIVKIDGDGQMNPSLIPIFVSPLEQGKADYSKGNRFTKPEDSASMPKIRLIGNAALSLLAKPSTGYWKTLDPTNGFTAIRTSVLKLLPLNKISKRYFFETDMLHYLRYLDACVVDIPMKAVYDDENSSLRWNHILFEFLYKHFSNTIKRVFFQYFIKDFSIATIQLLLGFPLLIFGFIFGIVSWRSSIATNVTASSGSVMLAALPVIVGIQMLLSFINYDISSVPDSSVSSKLELC